MELSVAIAGMLDAQAKLSESIADPMAISTNMYRLGQYTAAVEEHLAEAEKAYETKEAEILGECILKNGLSATAAEKHVKIGLGKDEGQIKYLSRMVSAAWNVHMSAMARIKHLQAEMAGSV